MNKLLGPITVLLAAAFAPLAQADIQITYTTSAGTVTCGPVTGPGATVICANQTGPPLVINTLDATSNSPGTSGGSFEESAVLDLSNSSGTDQTIVINVASDNFTLPTTPPDITLLSHIGGTVVTGATSNVLSYESCIGGNTLAGCPGTIQSGVGTPSITAAGSFSNDQTGTITSLSAPFSINEMLTITLDPGSNINFSASTSLTPVPEPASIALLGSVLFITVGLIRRKRNRTSKV